MQCLSQPFCLFSFKYFKEREKIIKIIDGPLCQLSCVKLACTLLSFPYHHGKEAAVFILKKIDVAT